MTKPASFQITFDVDWAPDFVIRDVANFLREYSVQSTWFVTHQSPMIRELQSDPLFELGIHPNFLPRSSHGSNHNEVIGHCLELLPDAKSCRTHCLAQDALILDALIKHGIEIDSSLLLFGAPNLTAVPYYSESGSLTRIPYCWEDCCALHCPPIDCDLAQFISGGTGMQIMSFHPMHIYLNSNSMDGYRRVTRNVKPLLKQTRDDLRPHVNHGFGIKDLFIRLLGSPVAPRSAGHLRDLNKLKRTELY